MPATAPDIADLAVIGDRRSAAVIDRQGAVVWYCPGRFDRPSLFAALLDPAAGVWAVEAAGSRAAGRRYVGDSAVLETRLETAPGAEVVLTDWMPIGEDVPVGALCRKVSAPPRDVRLVLRPRPDYGSRAARLVPSAGVVRLDDGLTVSGSHALEIVDGAVGMTVPAGEAGWAVLSDHPLAPTDAEVDGWLATTLDAWSDLAARQPYSGPYEQEIAQSLRAIRLLTHAESGGIIAAATTSLPEVPGGGSNWDYRYVWLRDAGMIVSALTRLGGSARDGARDGERYLDFVCASRGSSSRYPLSVFTSLDGTKAPPEQALNLAGFRDSRPVRVGNGAREQIQLDAFANVILAAKLIYRQSSERPHWDTVRTVADFLADNWSEPDHGIWEETPRRQYTSSKVVVACALESAAEYTADGAEASRWRAAARDVRAFVEARCITAEGAYAAVAGGQDVDVSAALFPVWAFTEADTPAMRATIAALERDWSWRGLLYWRRLECQEPRREGVFLAGTFWVAQYWVMRGNLDRARQIIDAALAVGSNDLGLFAEEVDPADGRLLGNIPQSFVHAAFIGAVIDLKAALETERTSP